MIVGDVWGGIQSFGLYQGIQTIFIEFQGCELRCKTCPNYRRRARGCGEYFGSLDLVREIKALPNLLHVSLCGGEPLLQEMPGFQAFLREMWYLEYVTSLWTTGVIPIRKTLGSKFMDYVALHIKFRPPSSGEVDKNVYDNMDCVYWDKDCCVLELRTKDDFEWAKDLVKENPTVNWVIVPMLDNKYTPTMIERVMEGNVFSQIGIQFPFDQTLELVYSQW